MGFQASDQQPCKTEHQDEKWHGKGEASGVSFSSYEMSGEDDQIAGNMGAEQAEAEETSDIRAAGNHAEHGRQHPCKNGAWICDAEPFVSGPALGVSLAKRRSESTQWFLRIWRFMRGQLVLREQERRRRARYQKVR